MTVRWIGELRRREMKSHGRDCAACRPRCAREGMSVMMENLAARSTSAAEGRGEEVEQRRGRGCHMCGSLDHQVRQCPKVPPGQLVCYESMSRKAGHRRSECPPLKREEDNKKEEKKLPPYKCFRWRE